MKDDCVFCREISGSRDTNFAERYPEIKSRILYETDSLIAFPCIGQLTKGHFLIVPKIHYATFNTLYSDSLRITEEIDILAKQMHEYMGFDIKESLFFEHGAFDSFNGGCGIYHAHIHVVPNAGDIDPKVIFNFSSDISHSNIEMALSSITNEKSYVFVGNYQHGFYSCTMQTPLPSQTLRRKIASVLGLEKWNWRETSREDSMLSSLRIAS